MMTHFADQWIFRNGGTSFNCSFNYICKKNIVELKLMQEPPKVYQKFIVSVVNYLIFIIFVIIKAYVSSATRI